MDLQRTPVAVIQPLAHDRVAFTSAWPRVLALLERACARAPRLAVLPEATIPGYVLGPEAVTSAEIARALDDVSSCARRHAVTIVCGAARIENGLTYNTALTFGPDGRELGYVAKRFLWHFDRHWFAAGEARPPLETPAGVLGLLVCADGRIPTIAATLASAGAEMLVMPTAWVTSGRDPAVLENLQADLLAPVRARENGLPFIAANKAGVELGSVAYCGKSQILDAAGARLALAAERSEEILFADVERAAARRSAPAPGWQPEAGTVTGAERVRFAFTPVRGSELASLERLALQADAAATLSADDAVCAGAPRVVERGGVRFGAVPAQLARSPRGLVAARMAGLDAFLWSDDEDDPWTVPFARARAAELRAYVVVFTGATRAIAIDPDGAVVAGTFESYRLAAFAYDRSRTAATQVAPGTDVLAGLRAAEAHA